MTFQDRLGQWVTQECVVMSSIHGGLFLVGYIDERTDGVRVFGHWMTGEYAGGVDSFPVFDEPLFMYWELLWRLYGTSR